MVMRLPNNLYFTGAPGSMWSAIARVLERTDCFNTSDRQVSRSIKNPYIIANHLGMYFDQVEGFVSSMAREETDKAFEHPTQGCKILKSHLWAYKLNTVKEQINDDWIMLVYRPDLNCLTWWNSQGGFNIDYPSYNEYKDNTKMLYEISRQNAAMLQFAAENDLLWSTFNSRWIKETFNITTKIILKNNDIVSALNSNTLVTVYKND